LKIEIRQARAGDLSEILRIERASFRTPWTELHWRYELEKSESRILVATVEGRVVGYVCGWVMGEEMEVANLAVDPQWRGRGLGKGLLKALLERALEEGVREVWLEVRESNQTAQKLYASLGFSPVGYRLKYYPDTGENALVMRLSLTEVPEILTFSNKDKRR